MMNIQPQPSTVLDPLASQFQNLNFNANIENPLSTGMQNQETLSNRPLGNGTRSISDAGLQNDYYIPGNSLRPQTAPVFSDNVFGFNYPLVFYQFDNNLLNGNMVPYVPMSMTGSSPRSVSPSVDNGNTPLSYPSTTNTLSMPDSIALNGQQVIVSGGNNVVLPPRMNPSYQPGLLQVPQGVPCFIVPQRTASVQSNVASPPRTTPSPTITYHQPQLTSVSECPEIDTDESKSTKPKDFDNPLSIKIDPPSNNQAHSWHTFGVPTMNYPYVSHPVFHLSPNHVDTFVNNPSIPNSAEQLPPQNITMPTMYMTQNSIPVLSLPTVSYPHPSFFSVPALNVSSLQMNINLQEQTLQSLHLDYQKTQEEISKCKEDILQLEAKLKQNLSSYNKEDLKKEISRLQAECLCLSQETAEEDNSEHSGDFYTSINTGQQGSLLPKKGKNKNSKTGHKSSRINRRLSKEEEQENNDSNKWNCSYCTYSNHPQLQCCEICQKEKTTVNKHPEKHPHKK